MRRKPGRLLALEYAVLDCGISLQREHGSFYGFALARELADGDSRDLASHGTLYKALARMKDAGLLDATWEESDAADAEGRPRRKLYTVTGEGRAVHAAEARMLETEHRLAAAVIAPTPEPAQ
jgi:DNA-binding PadR family transcriptional regulator